MALGHERDVIEVACNLLDPDRTSPQDVQSYLERLVADSGHEEGDKGVMVRVLKGYTTGKSRAELESLTLDAERLL